MPEVMKRIPDNIKARNFREKIERYILKMKADGHSDFALLIYVNYSIRHLVKSALVGIDKTHIRAVVEDNPAVIYIIKEEPVPFRIAEFLKQFYFDEIYSVEREEIRLMRMARKLQKLTREDPEAFRFFNGFVDWYKNWYVKTNAKANDWHIEELLAN